MMVARRDCGGTVRRVKRALSRKRLRCAVRDYRADGRDARGQSCGVSRQSGDPVKSSDHSRLRFLRRSSSSARCVCSRRLFESFGRFGCRYSEFCFQRPFTEGSLRQTVAVDGYSGLQERRGGRIESRVVGGNLAKGQTAAP